MCCEQFKKSSRSNRTRDKRRIEKCFDKIKHDCLHHMIDGSPCLIRRTVCRRILILGHHRYRPHYIFCAPTFLSLCLPCDSAYRTMFILHPTQCQQYSKKNNSNLWLFSVCGRWRWVINNVCTRVTSKMVFIITASTAALILSVYCDCSRWW